MPNVQPDPQERNGWEPRDDGITWAICAECGGNVFRHYAWSHEGGTPPQDHDAAPDIGTRIEGSVTMSRFTHDQQAPGCLLRGQMSPTMGGD